MKHILAITIVIFLALSSSQASTGNIITDPPSITASVNFYFPKNVYHFIIEEGINEYYDDLKTYLDENPDKKVELTGFADDGKNLEWNTRLSKYRARKVRDSLVKAGISKDKIKIEYKGKTKPLAKDESPEELAKNRRVELRII